MDKHKFFLCVVVCLTLLGMSETQAQVYIDYQADDMPDASGYTDRAPGCGSRTLLDGILHIIDDDTQELCGWYEQFQPFTSDQDGIFEACMKVNSSSHIDSVQFGFSDDAKKLHVRLLADQVSLGHGELFPFDSTDFHVYRIVKRVGKDVSLYIDDILMDTRPPEDFDMSSGMRQGFGGGDEFRHLLRSV